ncbi:MAG TPA: nucleotide disphospho-sugar-binding domain-containing protein, partial [Actinophytocola sp.]|nr:nucleotide disphospho-sugar-binding domain-containing protein [Actinophytocola sp.]
EATGRPPAGPVLDWPARADAAVRFTVPALDYPGVGRFVGPVGRDAAPEVPLPDWWADVDSGRPVVHVAEDAPVAPAVAGLAGSEVLVVVGSAVAGLLPPNTRAAPVLPYDKLLPRTSAVVTGGDWAVVHHALEHGVPLVVTGRAGARVARSGAGIALRGGGPRAVARAVRAVLSNPRYRAASEAVGAQLAAAPGLAGLTEVLDALVGPR